MGSHSTRIIILGLDGATLDIIRPLAEQGRLPNLARLMREGTWGRLRSTLPPVTAAAWSTFMTGLNPAGHGIFQWRTYDPTKYTNLDERVVSATRLAGRTFWDALGHAGYRVAVITVPVTYPPWQVNGYLLSGYPCPDSQRNYAYPPEWAASLERAYNFSADHYLSASDEEILRDGLDMLRQRTALALSLVADPGVDACVLVLGEIDRAQHDFFKYSDSRFSTSRTAPAHFREAIHRHYEVADEQVGRMMDVLASDGFMLVVSDHGGGPHPPRYFHANAWLRSRGWLHVREGRSRSFSAWARRGVEVARGHLPFEEALRRRLPARLVHRARTFTLNIADVDWMRTCAYRFPMYYPTEGIEVNLRGRQPQGIVAPGGEYERLVGEVMQALREECDPETGEPVAEEVYSKEEIYSGPYLDIAPDIVFVCRQTHRTGAEIGGAFASDVNLDALQKDNGVHTMDGILFAYGAGVAKGKELTGAHLQDIAPTVLHWAGVPAPAEVDGKVLEGIFEAADSRALSASQSAVALEPRESLGEITPEDEEEMLKKLRGLGYVE